MEIIFDISKEPQQFLIDGLKKYNTSKNKNLYIAEQKPFGYYVYEKETLIGGTHGYIDNCNWVYIERLYINQNQRGKDIGTLLMNKIEKFARDNNCIGMRTETWSFQALGFYEKMGFKIYGQMEDHPIGALDYYLQKKLK